MTVEALSKELDFNFISICEPEREVSGVYVGDLLSWVMGKAKSGEIWITIMSNANTVAVALLSDVSAILLTEGVTLDEQTLTVAKEKGINVMTTPLSSYEAAVRIHGLIK